MPTPNESSDPTPEEAVLHRLRERAAGTDLQIPPPSFEEMNAEIRAYDPEAQTLRVRMPVAARYENPTGAMQGGFVCAALDNVPSDFNRKLGVASKKTARSDSQC